MWVTVNNRVTTASYIANYSSGDIKCKPYSIDVAEGGETDFPFLGFKISPLAGSAVMWNNVGPDGKAEYRLKHAGRPPISGEKYAVNCFVNKESQLESQVEDQQASPINPRSAVLPSNQVLPSSVTRSQIIPPIAHSRVIRSNGADADGGLYCVEPGSVLRDDSTAGDLNAYSSNPKKLNYSATPYVFTPYYSSACETPDKLRRIEVIRSLLKDKQSSIGDRNPSAMLHPRNHSCWSVAAVDEREEAYHRGRSL